MARLPSQDDLRRIDRYLGDISTKLDRISSLNKDWVEGSANELKRIIDINNELDRLNKIAASGTKLTKRQKRDVVDLTAELTKLGSAWTKVGKIISGTVVNAVDKLGKSIIALGLTSFEQGLQKLTIVIKKVYELHERWTRVLGEFRTALGPTTRNMAGLTREAVRAEGKFRSLTDTFGLGIKEMEAVTHSFGFVDEKMTKFRTTAVDVGRAFGIGSDAAGKLARSFKLMGETSDGASDTFVQIAKDAYAAGVPVADYGREISEATEFMASFGKKGKDVFLGSAMYARRLGISLKSLEQFTRLTDTFDSTAQSMAKLNTVFGTSINSMEIMLENDPAKRFEAVRQALKGQGKDLENLTRYEKEFLAETMKISVEDVNAMIDSGETLDQIMKKRDKAARTEKKNQAFIQSALSKTRTTLHAFGQSWDKVTAALGKLVGPFTDMIGLTKKGGKGFGDFGKVMTTLFDKLTKFIDGIASNTNWSDFMKDLAADAMKLGKAIEKYLTGPEFRKDLDSVIKGAKDFYGLMKNAFDIVTKSAKEMKPTLTWIVENVKWILGAWAGMKAAIAGLKGLGLISGMMGGSGGIAGGASLLGKAFVGLTGTMVGAATAAGALGFAFGTCLDKMFDLSGKIEKFADRLLHGDAHDAKTVDSRVGNKYSELQRRGDIETLKLAKQRLNMGKGLSEGAQQALQRMGVNQLSFVQKYATTDKGKKLAALMEKERGERDKYANALKDLTGKELNVRKKAIFAQQVALEFQMLQLDESRYAAIREELGPGASRLEMLAKHANMNKNTELSGLIDDFKRSGGQFASGGIVTRPRMALVGEAGPEAIIPLRAMASGMQRNPAKFGGEAASRLVNFAAGRGGGQQQVKVVAGDVYLDGNKVGRHLVRQLLSAESGG